MKKLVAITTYINSWRLKHLNEREILLILSFVVGLLSGFAAIILKNLIYHLGKFLTQNFTSYSESYRYLAYPGIGILITVLYVRYFVKDDIGHGVTKVLDSIANKRGRMRAHNMFTSIISSTITIGFGGSVGAESPVAGGGGTRISMTFPRGEATK